MLAAAKKNSPEFSGLFGKGFSYLWKKISVHGNT